MCELFCFNSKTPGKVNDYLKQFYSHSDEHPHGWGLAKICGAEFIVDKEPIKATDSQYLKDILKKPIYGKNIFAHIRLATVGNLISSNCHPFTKKDKNGRLWILMHNGTIFDFPELDKYCEVEEGDTDSERILLYIIDKINKKTNLNNHKRYILISKIITDLSKENKINIMINDGEMTYIHSNMKDSLYYLSKNNSIIVASSPLNDENWQPVELNKIFAIKDGEIVFESEKHDYEFIFTEKHEKFIKENLESIDCEFLNSHLD